MPEGQELIWVSKEFADEYNNLKSVEEQERAVKKVIERKRLDLDEEQELLSESLLRFKSVCLTHKKELDKVYKEQADNIYKLWEECGDVSSAIARHAKEVANQISPIRKEIDGLSRCIGSLKKDIGGLVLYIPDQLARLASMVSQMDDATKTVLRELLNKGRKE